MTPERRDWLRARPGEAVKYIREVLGLSQESVAHLLDCTMGSVRRWEAGTYKPNPAHRRKIYEVLDTTIQAQIARERQVLGKGG